MFKGLSHECGEIGRIVWNLQLGFESDQIVMQFPCIGITGLFILFEAFHDDAVQPFRNVTPDLIDGINYHFRDGADCFYIRSRTGIRGDAVNIS
jgi:hypothetical protein